MNTQTILSNQFFTVEILTLQDDNNKTYFEFQITSKITGSLDCQSEPVIRESTAKKKAMKALNAFASKQQEAINAALLTNYSITELIAA